MTDESVPVPLAVKTSDLKVRTLSAVVMLLVAGGAWWIGGRWLDTFIVLVAIATYAEFVVLVFKATDRPMVRLAALLGGAAYIGLGALGLITAYEILAIVGAVIAVDIFAYFFGRTIGGPKIAPKISPSKTWAGLIGGTIGAALFLFLFSQRYRPSVCEWYYNLVDPIEPGTVFSSRCHSPYPEVTLELLGLSLLFGFIAAVLAQSGDFFESWLKRRAGVKDSSQLIPGHGGFFDRTDGIIPVACIAAVYGMIGS